MASVGAVATSQVPPLDTSWTGRREGPRHKPRAFPPGHCTSCLVPRCPFSSLGATRAGAQSLCLHGTAGGGKGRCRGRGMPARCRGCGVGMASTGAVAGGGCPEHARSVSGGVVGNLETVLCGNPARPGQRGAEGGHGEAAGSGVDPLREGPLLPTLHLLSSPWRTRCRVAPDFQRRKRRSSGSATCLGR